MRVARSAPRHPKQSKECPMLDAVYVLLTVVFFALCGAWMVFAETL